MKTLVAVLLSYSTIAFGEDAKVPSISIETKVEMFSQYVRDAELVSNKPVAQTEFTIIHKSGIYIGIFHSVGIDGTGPNSDFGDELDPYIGWQGEIEKFPVDVSVVYYDFYPLANRLNNAYGPSVKIGRPFELNKMHTITPFIKDDLYVMSGKADFEGGDYVSFGVEHSCQISAKVSFLEEALLVRSDGVFGELPGVSWQYTGLVNFKLNNTTKISVPSVQFSAPITSRNERFYVVFAAGLTATF